MRHLYYKLNDNKQIIPCDLMEYAEWSKDFNKRIVKQDQLPDGVRVSTVFLGLDHGWNDQNPVLFETMIFGGDHDQFQERYHTWRDAEIGHQRAIELIFQI